MRVLLVEDGAERQPSLETRIRDVFERTSVVRADSYLAILRILYRDDFDVAVVDQRTLEFDEAGFVEHLDSLSSHPAVVLVSHSSSGQPMVTSFRGSPDRRTRFAVRDEARLLGCLRDVLMREQSSIRLIEHQKEESLSVLAGGIAHDFNNMLVGVLGKAAMMSELLPQASKQAEYCEGIRRTAIRLADLARQLLAYARGGAFQTTAFNANDAARDTLAMLTGVVGPGVTIRTEFADDLWTVRGDPSQMVQALLNLSINACEAMGGGGVLTLSSRNVRLDGQWRCSIRDQLQPPGDYVELSVTDTGCGIEPRMLERMFKPYHSTKGADRGLGLAAVQGIVSNHGGGLTVSSELGRGAVFRIYLPRLRDGAAPTNESNTLTLEPSQATVLIVEDDSEVAEVAGDILRSRGHCVWVAKNGREAGDLFSAHAQEIDVLLLDMHLPDCTGADVLKMCRFVRPDLRAVISSGYDRESLTAKTLNDFDGVNFLPKPFSPTQLLELIQETLVQPVE